MTCPYIFRKILFIISFFPQLRSRARGIRDLVENTTNQSWSVCQNIISSGSLQIENPLRYPNHLHIRFYLPLDGCCIRPYPYGFDMSSMSLNEFFLAWRVDRHPDDECCSCSSTHVGRQFIKESMSLKEQAERHDEKIRLILFSVKLFVT